MSYEKEIKSALDSFVNDDYQEAEQKFKTVIKNKKMDYFKNDLKLSKDYGFGVNESEEKEYAWDKNSGSIVYRIPGKKYGDGQQDTDKNPVWLQGPSIKEAEKMGIDVDKLPKVSVSD